MPAQTPLISILSAISTPLPFITALLFLKLTSLNRDMKILLGYLGVATLTELIVTLFFMYNLPNHWVIHVYTLAEYLLVAALLAAWQNNSEFGGIIRLSIPLYLLVYAVIKISGWEDFSASTLNYLTRPIALILLNGFALYSLLTLSKKLSTSIYRDYRFWILAALAIYYTAAIILVAFMFLKDNNVLRFLMLLHSPVNILHNLLIIVGILCYWRFDTKRAIQPG